MITIEGFAVNAFVAPNTDTTTITAVCNATADRMLVTLVNAACDASGCDVVNLRPTALIDQANLARSSGLWMKDDVIYPWTHSQLLCRFVLLLHLNQMLLRALPLMSLSPRDDIGHVGAGCGAFVSLALSATHPTTQLPHSGQLLAGIGRWRNPSLGGYVRTHRGCVFTATKLSFWNALLTATATPTPLSQDEYEDPREIRVVKINRGPRAQKSALAGITNLNGRVKRAVFGQLFTELKTWNFLDISLRRSYLGKGHGGQRRAFKVKFVGEGVNDYGGPYRAVFEQIVDELQAEINNGKECLLPFLTPSPNRYVCCVVVRFYN